MHTRSALLTLTAIAALTVAGCTSGATASPSPDDPSPDASASQGAVTGQACLPVPGTSLVALEDDLMLQNSDNIIPAIGENVVEDAIVEALNAVSAQIDTDTLIALNHAVDIDGRTSREVAAEWVDAAGISATSTGSGSLVIGAADFSENITLAEIYTEVLRDIGYDASVRSIGNRETYLPELLAGDINIVPEYAATFAEFLNVRAAGDAAEPVASGDIAVTTAALVELGGVEGIVFGAAAGGQNQAAFAVTDAFSAEYGVTTLSELADNCGGIVLGGPPECPERAFCQLGLEETYGVEVAEFRSLDVGGRLTITAIEQGEIAVGMVFSSDGSLG
jgi:osmoprotectant transport system substrate-binding protein